MIIGLASVAASSAALLINKIASSTNLFNPNDLNISSIFFASGGKGIFISGFCKYPSTLDTISTELFIPLFRASLKAVAASSSVMDGRLLEVFLRLFFKLRALFFNPFVHTDDDGARS